MERRESEGVEGGGGVQPQRREARGGRVVLSGDGRRARRVGGRGAAGPPRPVVARRGAARRSVGRAGALLHEVARAGTTSGGPLFKKVCGTATTKSPYFHDHASLSAYSTSHRRIVPPENARARPQQRHWPRRRRGREGDGCGATPLCAAAGPPRVGATRYCPWPSRPRWAWCGWLHGQALSSCPGCRTRSAVPGGGGARGGRRRARGTCVDWGARLGGGGRTAPGSGAEAHTLGRDPPANRVAIAAASRALSPQALCTLPAV